MGRDGRGVKAATKTSIEVSFNYEGRQCRERIRLPPTTANLARVERHREDILWEIEKGTFDYAQVFPRSKNAALFKHLGKRKDTVGEYLEAWYDVKKTQVKASTARDYRSIIFSLVIPRLGKMLLRDLKRGQLRLWLSTIDDQQERKISNKRLANIQSCLRTALSDATDDEIIDTNPLKGFTFARKEAPREQDHADPLDPTEQAAVIASARHPQIANLFQFAFWTGMRTSEMIALDWRDIDWQRGVVMVRKAMTRAAKGEAEKTKTFAGRRDVRLLPAAHASLEAQKKYTLSFQKAVFHNPGWRGRPAGRWAGDDQIWETWGTALRRAGVRYRNPYQTRHTYASMMLSAGEHPMWVARQMGHSDTTSIMRNYGRWMPVSNPTAGSKADAMFGAKSTGAADPASS